jgi:hypothetical protein
MSDTLKERLRGRSEAWLRERSDILYDEIDSNNEENRTMQAEIDTIWEVIGEISNTRHLF